MDIIYLYYILQFIKELMGTLILFLLYDKMIWSDTSPKDYLRCPYFYIMIVVDELIKITMTDIALRMVLLSMSYFVFSELIRRHLDNV